VHQTAYEAIHDVLPDYRSATSNTRTRHAELTYRPRPHFVTLHQRDTRWACMVAHRRAGKTVACVNEAIIRALYTDKKRARYAYLAPFYSQAKQVAWEYLKEYAQPFIESSKDIRESELSVRLFNQATIRLYGADNPDALRGIYLDGIVLDEFGQCRPSLWGEVILPTLADRKGWAIFIGTPCGKNHFYDINQRARKEPGWFHLELKASESNIISMDELREMRAQMSESEYAQEFECDFTAAVMGTYYAQIIQLMEQRQQIRPRHPLHDPAQPTHVVADLGYKDSTALWFWQHAPDGIAVIDYYENSGKPLAHYMDYLDQKPYRIEKLWLPHDARAKTLQTGRSTVEQFLEPQQTDEHGAPLEYDRTPYPVDLVPNLKKQQGIDAARLVLPHCYINQETCYAGIEALRAYRRKFDELKKVFSNEPLHDWASDGADSFRYLSLVAREHLPNQPATTAPTGAAQRIQPQTRYTLQELFNQHESTKKFDFERARL